MLLGGKEVEEKAVNKEKAAVEKPPQKDGRVPPSGTRIHYRKERSSKSIKTSEKHKGS